MEILCGVCGGVNDTTDKFCSACGSVLPETCPRCGAVVREGASFCGQCGYELATTDGSNGDPEKLASTSNGSGRRVEESEEFPGERKHVTVMFADVKSSTELVEDLDAEQAVNRISSIMKVLRGAIHEYDGVVNRVEGDGLMALFGAPIAREDHAICACNAALEMRDRIAEQYKGQVEIRIGLNSGEAVLHSISNDLSSTYDAGGKTVIVARRMENVAEPSRILITDDTFKLADGYFKARSLGTNSLKGVSGPVGVYELEDTTSRSSRWSSRSHAYSSVLVGRDQELVQLGTYLLLASEGKGQAVSVVGEPGIGKSRLVHQLLSSQAASEFRVLGIGADQQGRHTTYLQISNFLRSWMGIQPEDPLPTISARVRDLVQELDSQLEQWLPALFSLLDVTDHKDRVWMSLDASQQRDQVSEAFSQLLLAQSRRQPTLVVFEDVHWIDAGTRAVLDRLARRVEHAPLALCITFRPEFEQIWSDLNYHSLLELAPLDGSTTSELADRLMGTDDSLVRLKEQLCASVEGVPLFLEELVQSLVENKAIAGQPGQYRLIKELADVQIPPSVQNVLAARIDSLPAPLKLLLQTAAVAGKNIQLPLLVLLSDHTEDDLVPMLAALGSADFLNKLPGSSGLEYSFKHELTREVAYLGLLKETRRKIHGRAVRAIEELNSERLEEHVDRLANHAFNGEKWPQAVKYHLRSLLRAVQRWAHLDALTIFQRGIEALQFLPESPERAVAEIDFRLLVITALIPLGRHRQLLEILGEADEIASKLGDKERLAAVNCQLTVANWMKGDHQEALARAGTALEISNDIGSLPLQIAALNNRGMVLYEMGVLPEAVVYLNQALEKLTDEIDEKHVGWPSLPSVSIRTFMASAHYEMGNYDEAEHHANEAINKSDAANHAYSQSVIYHVRVRIHIERGELDEALERMLRALAICKQLQIYKMYPIVAARLIEVYLARGELEKAFEAFEIPAMYQRYDNENLYGWTQLSLARGNTYLAAGMHDDAFREARQCLRVVSERGEQPKIGYCYKLLGDIYAQLDESFRARGLESYRAAIEVAEQTGMRPLKEYCAAALSA